MNNFMNKILINPLSDIIYLIMNDETIMALKAMRGYIKSLPPMAKSDLDGYADKIDGFLRELYSIKGRNWSHVGANRLNYVKKVGSPLCREVYDQLFPLLYDTKLFDALSNTIFFNPARGRKSGDSEHPGFPKIIRE